MDPLTPRSPYNQPLVGQISTLAPGLAAHPVTAGSTSNTFAGQSPAPFSNSPAFYDPTYSFTGQSPGPFWTLPGNHQSPSSPWNLFREAGEFGNTNAPGFEYNPETCETKLIKLVQLIKDSEEIGNVDYTQTMLEVNSLVYDLVTEDEPKFDALFEETLDESHPMCYICSGMRKIGDDKMAQKVESERLLLEAIAVSAGRFGEDHNTTLHFRYNLLVLYQGWSCRVENIPALLAQIAEAALRRTLAGTNSLPLLHLIISKSFEKLVYSCRFYVVEDYPTWLGCLFSMLQGLSIPSDEEGRNIQENLWNMAKKFGFLGPGHDDWMEPTVPLLDLILRLGFTISNALRSVHFWTAVFLLAIGQYREPIFNSRHIISNAVTQTSLSCAITLSTSLDQSAIIPSQQADPKLNFELVMALVEVSLEEIEIIGDSRTVGSTSKLLEWQTIMDVLVRAAEHGNSRVITLLAKHFKNSEFHWGHKWENILDHDGEISEYGLEPANAPLCIAAKAGCEPAVRALIDAGAYVDGPCEADATPLVLAIKASHYSIVRLLIEEGAGCCYGETAYVIDSSDRKLQDIWIESIFFKDDWSAIFEAVVLIAKTEKYDPYDMLYEKIRSKLGEGEDKSDSKHELSLLTAKMKKFSLELRDILWECMNDDSGRGLELILSSLTGRHVEQQVRLILGKVFLEMTRLLRELPKVDEPSGLLILHLLVSRNAPNALSVFLDLGADTKVTDDQNNTALHIAASRNRIACARQLLQHGIEVEAEDALGQTALQVADRHGHRAFMELVSAYVGGDD
jgi:ankyrin repeat protein